MSAEDKAAIEQSIDRLVQLATSLGVEDADEWELVDGEYEVDVPRTPWMVTDGEGRRLLTLGYTRRDASRALSSMTSILTVVATNRT